MSRLLRTLSLAILTGSLLAAPLVADAATPTVRTIPLTNPGVRVVLSPDGKTVAVFTDSVSDTAILSTPRAVAFAPDSSRIAAYHGNGRLDVWSLSGTNPYLVKAIETLDPFVNGVAFLPDGTLVAQGTERPERFRFWSWQTGVMTAVMGRHFDSLAQLKDSYQMPGMGDVSYTSFAVSPDGRTLATATLNDEIQLSPIPGQQSATIRPPSQQPGGFNLRGLVFTSDGKRLVWFDRSDSNTHVWDVASEAETVPLAFGGQQFALSPDGTQLAWATAVGDTTTVSLASLSGARQPAVVATLPNKLSSVTALAFTPDGKEIMVGGFAPAADGTNAIAIITLG